MLREKAAARAAWGQKKCSRPDCSRRARTQFERLWMLRSVTPFLKPTRRGSGVWNETVGEGSPELTCTVSDHVDAFPIAHAGSREEVNSSLSDLSSPRNDWYHVSVLSAEIKEA
eukprot:9535166-Alexandrium_andersonii.AAC.1